MDRFGGEVRETDQLKTETEPTCETKYKRKSKARSNQESAGLSCDITAGAVSALRPPSQVVSSAVLWQKQPINKVLLEPLPLLL